MSREIMPGVTELTREEGRAMFDQACQREMRISGDEFLRRWDSGEYTCAYPAGAFGLSMLIPFARQEA